MAEFDDIRPFTDAELPAAMHRIVSHPFFGKVASYVYPGRDLDEVRNLFTGFKSIFDFQHVFVADAVEAVVAKSTEGLSCDGTENLDNSRSWLFVSNHRDIVLDAAFQTYLLDRNGLDTPQISFGANLMQEPIIVDLGKANKMYRVARPNTDNVTARDFYNLSKYLSDYIRYVICQKHESVWIAQRNGRTKNGIDRTDPGIIKMFGMSGTADNVASYAEMNILPVSMSYEWEPCDILKAVELYKSSLGAYVKQPGEDVNSILTGILQPKGHVHVHFCKPVDAADLEPFASLPSNAFRNAVASLMDERIIAGFKLYPNNYIAADILSGKEEYKGKYTSEQYTAFVKHISQIDGIPSLDHGKVKEILLGIYANPAKAPLSQDSSLTSSK